MMRKIYLEDLLMVVVFGILITLCTSIFFFGSETYKEFLLKTKPPRSYRMALPATPVPLDAGTAYTDPSVQ